MIHTLNGRGLGDAQTHQLIMSTASTGLSMTAMLYTALAADPEPFSKAALAVAAGVVALLQTLGAFSGCGQTCVLATNAVDQLEPYLKKNRDQYLAQTGRTAAMQQTALALFDSVWSDVLTACGDPKLGDAGKRCISERQRGGTAPWCPQPGHTGCDWFALYRDPIATDPQLTASSNAAIAAGAADQATNYAPLILIAIAIGAFLLWE